VNEAVLEQLVDSILHGFHGFEMSLQMSESEFDLDLKRSIGSQKSALIVKFGQIGDVIMAIPAVHALHQQGFNIHWVCGRTVQPLLERYSWINLIPVDDKAILLGKLFSRARNIAALWNQIAFRSYDLSAVLYYDRRYRLLTLPVRARRKIALSQQSRATTLVPGRPHADEYLRILLGNEDGYLDRSIPPVRPDRLPPSPWQAKGRPRRIAIVPGGAGHLVRQQILTDPAEPAAVRRWPIESYVALTQRLLDRGYELVLLGGPEDAWAKPHFQQLVVTDCIGTLSLPEVISACDACDAVISHDTGPLHLAGLSRTCLIGIFGPTNPATFLPRRSFVTGIWGGRSFACRPCYDGRDFAPCRFNGCMHEVTVELVLRELDRLLEDQSQGRSNDWRIICQDDL
jgi:heptosyltransferase-2